MFREQQSFAYLDVDSNDAKAEDLHHSSTSIPVGPSNTLHMHACICRSGHKIFGHPTAAWQLRAQRKRLQNLTGLASHAWQMMLLALLFDQTTCCMCHVCCGVHTH